ncbi:MAG: hypothetical protein HQL19_05385 [Candidatus Omnitrophica bacterium]|nr:hypothetical protein [Candidatus Omnitrophota bacterium]
MRGYLLAIIFLCSGCAALSHWDEAMTLKDYADEKDAQADLVQKHDALFEQLAAMIRKHDSFERYRAKASLTAAFGDPILVKQVERDGKTREEWLYRRIVKPMESPKVYFFFNDKGVLVEWTSVGIEAGDLLGHVFSN